MSDKYLVLDIETIPAQSLPEGCVPVFDETQVKLGVLKDRFKIEAKIEEERMKFESDISKRMSLDPDLCEVCAVVTLDSTTGYTTGAWTSVGMNDFDVVYETWDKIRSAHSNNVPIVTFNGKSFDIPVLVRRAMFLDISVAPGMVADLLNPRRYYSSTQHHIDLMEILGMRNAFSGRPEFKSLAYYLRRFEIGEKMEGMTGADVYPLWKEGSYSKIVDYCSQDVLKTRDLYERVSPWLVATKPVEADDIKDVISRMHHIKDAA
jgi:predicted PolB exonuclease-like 3'-5' exonuclease